MRRWDCEFRNDGKSIRLFRDKDDSPDIIVDIEDFEKIRQKDWFFYGDDCLITTDDYVKMEHFILDHHLWDIEHVNGNVFDNRKINLHIDDRWGAEFLEIGNLYGSYPVYSVDIHGKNPANVGDVWGCIQSLKADVAKRY